MNTNNTNNNSYEVSLKIPSKSITSSNTSETYVKFLKQILTFRFLLFYVCVCFPSFFVDCSVFSLAVIPFGSAVKKHQRPRRHLNRHLNALIEAVALRCEVEFVRIFVLPLRVEIARLVRARNHVEAAIGHRGVVDRDPRADQRAIAGGDIDLVLMPGLPLEIGRFDEVHRLHALNAAIPMW